MISLTGSSGLGALTSAQNLLDRTATSIAKNGPSATDSVNLLIAKAQFSVGTKVIKTQDELTQKLLDIFA